MTPVATNEPAKAPTQPLKAPPKTHQSTANLSANPLARIWRGDKAGTLALSAAYPDFNGDKYTEREHIKRHMAAAFRYWGKLGFGEGVAGHITVKDPVLPDHYWMNPFAVHFSSITVSKLVLVGPDGYVAPGGAQLPINTAGFHIHSAIHRARPDLKAAAHCHSVHGKAWSVFGKPIDCLTQDSCLFYDNLGVYNNFGGIVLADEEGENIAAAMGTKFKTCILQNHGLMTAGQTVDEAVYLFSALDKLCQAQLLVEAASEGGGLKKSVIEKEDAAFTAETLQHWEIGYLNFQPEYELLLEETNGAFLK